MTAEQRIQQLEYDLASCAELSGVRGYAQIDALNELAWLLRDTDTERALTLSAAAAQLAEAAADGSALSQAGIVYSLRTQGYLNMRSGDYTKGLVQLLKAQAIFETLTATSVLAVDDGLIDVFDGIAGIHVQMGNLPEGLDYTYRMLTLARRIDDTQRICNANNNLAVIYSEQGDRARCYETLEQNLSLAIKIGDQRIEAISNLNLAHFILRAGDYPRALDYGLRGLQISQEAGFKLFEVYAFDFIGKIQLKLGYSELAIAHLEQALAGAQQLGSKANTALHLLDLGQAYYELGQPAQALDYLQQGVAAAQAIKANRELSRAYLTLTDATGAYETPGLEPGTYTLLFDTIFAPTEASRGYLDEYFDNRDAPPYAPVSVAVGATTTANAGLARGGQIAGRVTVADSGLGLSGVAVLVFSGNTLVSFTMTDSSGAYTTAGLPAGSYTLQFDPTLSADQDTARLCSQDPCRGGQRHRRHDHGAGGRGALGLPP